MLRLPTVARQSSQTAVGPAVESSFAWLDRDAHTRRRMMEVVDFLREKGTLDERGIGTLRDAFAD